MPSTTAKKSSRRLWISSPPFGIGGDRPLYLRRNLRRNPAYTGDRNELRDGIAERRQQFFDPSIEGCDVPLQFFDQPEMMGDQKSMMHCHAPIEGGGQIGSGAF